MDDDGLEKETASEREREGWRHMREKDEDQVSRKTNQTTYNEPKETEKGKRVWGWRGEIMRKQVRLP